MIEQIFQIFSSEYLASETIQFEQETFGPILRWVEQQWPSIMNLTRWLYFEFGRLDFETNNFQTVKSLALAVIFSQQIFVKSALRPILYQVHTSRELLTDGWVWKGKIVLILGLGLVEWHGITFKSFPAVSLRYTFVLIDIILNLI